jgi:hypothetical protein
MNLEKLMIYYTCFLFYSLKKLLLKFSLSTSLQFFAFDYSNSLVKDLIYSLDPESKKSIFLYSYCILEYCSFKS